MLLLGLEIYLILVFCVCCLGDSSMYECIREEFFIWFYRYIVLVLLDGIVIKRSEYSV